MVTPGDRTPPSIRLWEIPIPDGRGLRQLLPDWSAHRRNAVAYGRATAASSCSSQAEKVSRSLGSAGRWTRIVVRRRRARSRLTSGPTSFSSPAPGPSADTLFAVGRPDRGELVRYNLKRREFSTQLDGLAGQWVTYSPDGGDLAYVGYPKDQLWRVRADGTDKRPLTTGPFETDGASWSPDGKSMASAAG